MLGVFSFLFQGDVWISSEHIQDTFTILSNVLGSHLALVSFNAASLSQPAMKPPAPLSHAPLCHR